MQTSVHIVIMAGGIGSRFWPVSTPEFPKQFVDILGCGRTLIQLTADRFEGVSSPDRFWVVTNESYVDLVRSQLPDIPAGHILAEPAARSTAPCVAWAAWKIKAEDPDANIVFTPSDAFVTDPAEFRRVMANALSFTQDREVIVTIGIRPTRPETGYGYIELASVGTGKPAPAGGVAPQIDAVPVVSFREKPDSRTACGYLKEGRYLWNAGIFVWNATTVQNAIRRYKPDMAEAMDRIAGGDDVAAVFPGCEKISVDYAVMEPAAAEGKIYTLPAEFGWSDLGNWASLYGRLAPDSDGNAAVGPVRFVECRDCIAHADDASQVVLQGLDNCIVSARKGRILVCRRDQEQRIKDFAPAEKNK